MHPACYGAAALILLGSCAEAPPVDQASPHYQEATMLSDRGAGFLKQGRPQKAVDLLQQALAKVPDLAEAHFNLGLARMRLGQHGAAIGSFQRALEIDAQNPVAQFSLAVALRSQHRYSEAVDHLRLAIMQAPNQANYHYQLGETLRATSDFDGALSAFGRTVELDPAHAEALYFKS